MKGGSAEIDWELRVGDRWRKLLNSRRVKDWKETRVSTKQLSCHVLSSLAVPVTTTLNPLLKNMHKKYSRTGKLRLQSSFTLFDG